MGRARSRHRRRGGAHGVVLARIAVGAHLVHHYDQRRAGDAAHELARLLVLRRRSGLPVHRPGQPVLLRRGPAGAVGGSAPRRPVRRGPRLPDAPDHARGEPPYALREKEGLLVGRGEAAHGRRAAGALHARAAARPLPGARARPEVRRLFPEALRPGPGQARRSALRRPGAQGGGAAHQRVQPSRPQLLLRGAEELRRLHAFGRRDARGASSRLRGAARLRGAHAQGGAAPGDVGVRRVHPLVEQVVGRRHQGRRGVRGRGCAPPGACGLVLPAARGLPAHASRRARGLREDLRLPELRLR